MKKYYFQQLAEIKTNTYLFNFETKYIKLYSNLIIFFCLLNILILSPDIFEIFAKDGLIKESINVEFIYPYNPLLNWFTSPLTYIGIPYSVSLLLFITIYVISLVFNLINYKKLTFATIAWVFHIAIINSSYFFSYGADYFLTFALFINIFFSIPSKKLNQKKVKTIHSFIIRFTQIQMCFVYFFAGFGKSLGTDWFDGNAIWYILNSFSPKITESFFYHFIDYPLFFIFLGWSTILIELLYPILMNLNITRKITLLSIISLHLGIIFFMKFYTFGLIMIILNLIAWGDYLFDYKRATKLNYKTY
jgi:hypothetical protein